MGALMLLLARRTTSSTWGRVQGAGVGWTSKGGGAGVEVQRTRVAQAADVKAGAKRTGPQQPCQQLLPAG